MHAFLLIGNNEEELQIKIQELNKKLKTKALNFPLAKIEDTRELNKFLRLSFAEPTLIVIRDIHEATTEALNAFLKVLEEPQENIYFALTAPTVQSVLPTIISRCKVIKLPITNFQLPNNSQIPNFQNLNTEQKIQFFDKIKERNDAISFVEDLIFYLHSKNDFRNMEPLTETLTRLKGNGNVNLQLTNLAIQYKQSLLEYHEK